jgi:peptidoglycan hydrolase-like protein with peptidoglycan-binding domain
VIKGSLANRRWDQGILVPGISYAEPDELAPAAAPAAPAKILRQTTNLTPDPAVARIQQALSDAGFNPGKSDGIFGSHTEAAVIAFQNANGLTPDGEVGVKTADALGISLD